VNNCPGGICISGGTVTAPAVYNFREPPPNLTFTVHPKPTETGGAKRLQVDIKTDRAIANPTIGIIFSGPVEMVGAVDSPAITLSGFTFREVKLAVGGVPVPNSIAVAFGGATLLPGQDVLITVASSADIQVLRVVSVAP
jgi:hypothetical protein